jgi:hypothetical protein
MMTPSRQRTVRFVAVDLGRSGEVSAHAHTTHQLLRVERGAVAFTHDVATWVVPTGGSVWIPAGLTHRFEALEETTAWGLYVRPADVKANPAYTSLPANEQYSFLFTEQFGAIFGYTTRDVPITQVLDHALLNGAARRSFAGFDYGRANIDAADQTERLSTGAIGVSDHDGFVVRLATDRIFADGFGGD